MGLEGFGTFASDVWPQAGSTPCGDVATPLRFSVVIPAYNAEAVLAQCLESVLSQGERSVEAIVVDDGSTDSTAQLARRLAQDDDRITVLSQRNGGVSAARNAGLDAATGKVVLFVDADDALESGALESIWARFVYGGLDCLVFGMRIEPEDAMPLTLSHRLAPGDAIIEDDARRLIFAEHTHPYAFRVAFSRDFLVQNSLRFDRGLTLGEDEAFLMTAYRLAHRAILSSERLYVYRMSADSASHRDNASDEVLPAKLQKHLALVQSVLWEWQARQLDDSCDQDLLDWLLDLLMLDVSRLEPEAQARFYASLWPVLTSYFGSDGGQAVAHATARRCLLAIREAAAGRNGGGPVVPKPLLVAFYLHSRGAGAVVERAIASLRGRGAY